MQYNIKPEHKLWAEMKWKQIQKKLDGELFRMNDKIPYIAKNGCYEQDMAKSNIYWWTNGFWAGIMWQAYSISKEKKYMDEAIRIEALLDGALKGFEGLHHDVGFMWLLTAVADFRITGNKESKTRGLHAASLLAGRFNIDGKYIRAWNQEKSGWIIIDCMMNLSLLFWAGKELDDPRFAKIACAHAITTANNLLRNDGSTAHIGVFEPNSGNFLYNLEGQGYAPGSSWSRGQAWAIYGFALCYWYTGETDFLQYAKKTAHYFLANVSQTKYVSKVDFRAPEEPVMLDTTASACAACGLLLLADMVDEYEKSLYYDGAMKILQALDNEYVNLDSMQDGILEGGCEAYNKPSNGKQSIIYGDYFFIEGITKLIGKEAGLFTCQSARPINSTGCAKGLNSI